MHRFFTPSTNIDTGRILLGADETHHLRDVLRRGVGEIIRVFDGEGNEYECRISAIAKRSAELEIVNSVSPTMPESPLDLTLAVAVLKGEKFDLVIQKAVELGVTRLVPLLTVRSDVRVKDGDKKQERWQKIAVEAARQCGRATLMAVERPAEFSGYIGDSSNADSCRILFSERGGSGFESIGPDKKITAFIGPEGGWDDLELEAACREDIAIVTLGGRILRAETAAIAITAILQHRYGDIA